MPQLTIVKFNRGWQPELKRFYEKRRSEILARKLEIKSRIKVEGTLSPERKTTYYSDWIYSAIHIGNDHSLVKTHHTNWRLRALTALTRNSPEILNYSSVVSCSENDSVKIREVLLKAIQEIRVIVRDSPSEQLYCYNLDFFDV